MLRRWGKSKQAYIVETLEMGGIILYALGGMITVPHEQSLGHSINNPRHVQTPLVFEEKSIAFMGQFSELESASVCNIFSHG